MNTKEGYFFDVLGDSHSGLGRHDKAIEAYRRAVAGFHAQGTEHAYVHCLLKIAVCYRALGKKSHAVRYLQACLPLIRELRLVGYEEIALRELAACEVASAVTATAATDQPLSLSRLRQSPEWPC